MTNLYGRNLRGEPQDNDSWPEQADTKELIDAIDSMLDMDHVRAVSWTQHTPSFNDGEPCRFGVGTVSVSLEGVERDEDADWYDDENGFFISEYDLYSFKDNEDGSTNWDEKVWEVSGVPTKAIYDKLNELEAILDNGSHYAWLMTSFGDPAEVIATKEDFIVERYEGE